MSWVGDAICSRRPWVVIIAVLAVACSDAEDGGSAGAGNVHVETEGSGAANLLPLSPMRGGSVFGFRRAAIRRPIDLGGGRIAHPYIVQPQTTARSVTIEPQSELWFSVDDRGVWFEGDSHTGLQESGLLLVPSTVRLGMRWRTGADKVARSYEVIRRTEAATVLGPTVFWTIKQEIETPIYRMYAEGWGLVNTSVGTEIPASQVMIRAPLRAVTGDEPESVDPTGTSLELSPALDLGAASAIERIDSVRAIRLGGGRMLISLYGVDQPLIVPPLLDLHTKFLTYQDGNVVPNGSLDSTLSMEIPPSLPGTRSYTFGPDALFAYGNTLHSGGTIFHTSEDILIYQNTLGGVGGSAISGLYPAFQFRFELPLVEPYFTRSERPLWGALPSADGRDRILLGGESELGNVPFARVAGRMGELWTTHQRPEAYGRFVETPTFVEAFPDTIGTDLSDKRGPLISTTSGPDTQVHLLTTPGGMIDRLLIGREGATRARLGRVKLPAGHELRAAVDPGDGKLVVFTYARGPHTAHVWTTPLPAPITTPAAPFISLKWSYWDARICWPTTDAPLDGTDWRLGQVPAAAVIPISDNCALVARDLEARPLPPLEGDGLPTGWGVFEGTVPGVGHVRAYEEGGGHFDRMPAPGAGAWLKGGGAVAGHVPDVDHRVGLEFSPGGIPRGTAVHLERIGDAVPDQSGAGMWTSTYSLEYASGECPSPCSGTPTWVIALGGPQPQLFPLDGMFLGEMMPVHSGGVVVPGSIAQIRGSDHRGPIHLRPDGSFVEITLPDHYTARTANVVLVRKSGEVCGTGALAAGPTIWCSKPDGSEFREAGLGTFLGTSALDGFHMLNDNTALGRADATQAPALAVVDLNSLQVRPYPGPLGIPAELTIGADGVSYGRLDSIGQPSQLGAFTKEGFVPLQQIYDVAALYDQEGGYGAVQSFLVTEYFAMIQLEFGVLRIARDRWDGASGCQPTTATGLDVDGDGYVADTSCGDDCDDSDGTVHPGAIDACGDGIDSNCDGDPDGGGACWADADGDGYAPQGAAIMSACTCPTGFTDLEPIRGAIDCIDDNADAFPGQTESFPTDRSGGIVGSFDYDCDGMDTPRWPDGAGCTWNGAGCDKNEGFLRTTACGRMDSFLGCPEPGTCSQGDCFDTGSMSCAVPRTIGWTQACR